MNMYLYIIYMFIFLVDFPVPYIIYWWIHREMFLYCIWLPARLQPGRLLRSENASKSKMVSGSERVGTGTHTRSVFRPHNSESNRKQ
jgi:hypothetical protein